MKVGLAQIDTRIGDFTANREIVLEAWAEARAAGAELVVFPELCITGYPPRDLLLDPSFVAHASESLAMLAAATAGGPPLLVGAPLSSGETRPGHPGIHNAAVLLAGGRPHFVQPKRLLPAYDVFHEPRWFLPGRASAPVRIAGRVCGLVVCEDLWDLDYPVHPAAELRAAGAELILCLSASPWRDGIAEERRQHAERTGLPIVYVNAVGGNDECIFDGGSFALGGDGRPLARLPRFRPAVAVVDLDAATSSDLAPELDRAAAHYQALVLGVASFARKNGLRQAFLGLSGGIDSALVATIAADALGPAAVTALALPSRHTDPRSTEAAAAIARALGIGFEVLPLDDLHRTASAMLGEATAAAPGATVDENLQARLRAVLLMARVNRTGGLLLNTSNKTELALGYGTLYGDLAGALAVIGDLHKPDVYALAAWRNSRPPAPPIPAFVMERPPSAELRPGQVDPFDYPRIAPVVEALLRGGELPPGTDPAEASSLARLIRQAEHKRWQAGIVLRLSDRAFGRGRMMPVTRA